MPRRTVGVELGTEEIRLARIVGGWQQFQLDGWQVRPLPPAGQVDHHPAAVQALRELAAAGWFKADQVTITLSGDQVVSRAVTVPFQDPQKVRQVLAYEVEGLLPFNLDDVIVSPATIRLLSPLPGSSGRQEPGGSRVLALALPKNRLRAALELCAEAGLDPSAVEVTPVGLARFARAAASAPGRRTGGPPAAEASPTLAVLDLGQSGTTVAFCRDGGLAQFRALPGRAGLSPEGDQLLLAELKRAVHFYELDERSDVAELLVCGARAAEADALVDRLGDELGVRPMALESAGLLRRTAGAADAAAVLPAFASAIGAALRPPDEQFNFRQAEFLSPGERSRARTRSVGMAAAVAALVVLGGANLFAHYYLKEQAYTALRDDQRRLFTETFSDVRVVVDELEQARGAMLALSRRAAFLGEGELGALVALERLTRTLEALPELKVDRLQIAGNDVRFEGEVGSFEAVDRVKELLRQLESASQVTISDARLGVDQQRVRFKASLLFGSATAGAGEGTPGRGERIG